MNTTSTTTPKQELQKPERMPRGTVPPALKLSEAISLAKKINDNAGGSANYDLFSQLTGNTKTSSSFARKVAALRQFGIIEDRDNFVTLSEIGNRISTPRDENDDALAAKEALIRIDLLNKIYERHRGRLLPEDQFLANILIQELKVPREMSRVWVEFFKDAATAAKLLFNRTDGKTQVLDEPNGMNLSTSSIQASPVHTVVQEERLKTQNYDFADALPIPLGPGKLVLIKLPENWNAGKDLKRLVKMLELSLSEEVDEDQLT